MTLFRLGQLHLPVSFEEQPAEVFAVLKGSRLDRQGPPLKPVGTDRAESSFSGQCDYQEQDQLVNLYLF